MVDGVAVRRLARLAHLGVAHLEIVRRPPHQGRGAGEAEDAGVEEFGIGLEHPAAVAFRVHRDEDGLEAGAGLAQLLEDRRHFHQGGGAHVGTIGIAEGDELELAAEILTGHRASVGVRQQVAGDDTGCAFGLFRGQAVADEPARAAGRRVVPACSYVARFIEKNPEFADLVA